MVPNVAKINSNRTATEAAMKMCFNMLFATQRYYMDIIAFCAHSRISQNTESSRR